MAFFKSPTRDSSRIFGIHIQLEICCLHLIEIGYPGELDFCLHIIQDSFSKGVEGDGFQEISLSVDRFPQSWLRFQFLVRSDDLIGLLLNIGETSEVLFQRFEDLLPYKRRGLCLSFTLQNPDVSLNHGKRCPQFMREMVKGSTLGFV